MAKRPRRIWLGAAVAFTVLAAARADVDPERTVGTVRSVDMDTRQVTVLTGCGHALRVVVFRAAPDCRIEVAGSAALLASVKRGQVVEIRHKKAQEPRLADSIVTVRVPDDGRER